MFQSTHPRRVRPIMVLMLCMMTGFNPRTHVGCDHWLTCNTHWTNSFNPRTHVGCDCIGKINLLVFRCFNPRTHVGCDPMATTVGVISFSFNPRTHVGCDFKVKVDRLLVKVSIHAPT